MNNNKNLITPAGLKKLKEELKEHMTDVRQHVAEDIQKAKEFGDLSENAAYTSAMDARDLNEARIAELEDLINNSRIVTALSHGDGVISIGNTVTLKTNLDNEITITIVGIGEGDPSKGKITSDTPLSQSILGKKVKDNVVVELPSGRVTYQILKVK